jgi:excisionase family DNA binding protein
MPSETDLNSHISVAAAAELLGWPKDRVRRAIRSKKLSARKFGWMVMLRKSDIAAMFVAHSKTPNDNYDRGQREPSGG